MTAKADDGDFDSEVRRAAIIEDLRRACESAVRERADRYLQVEHHDIIGGTPFAAASAECVLLFRDGHFYGCVSLSQAVGEALVRHMCRSNGHRPAKDFKQNVGTLKRRAFIDGIIEQELLTLWKSRNDYHHLNNGIEQDAARLEALALEKVQALAKVEAFAFAYESGAGGIVVRYPQYWPTESAGTGQVFLRISP